MGNACASQRAIEDAARPLRGDESDEELRTLVCKKGSRAAAALLLSQEEVHLDKLPLREKGGRAVGLALRDPACRVETLTLRYCQLVDAHGFSEKLATFAAGLAANRTLKWLDLRNNAIDDYAGERLAEGLAANRTLEVLDVSHNNLGWNGGGSAYRALAKALPKTSVVELRIGANDTQGLALLLAGAAAAPQLKFVDAISAADGATKTNLVKCDVCHNIGHRARVAARRLASVRPDMAVSFTDAVHGAVHLNVPTADCCVCLETTTAAAETTEGGDAAADEVAADDDDDDDSHR